MPRHAYVFNGDADGLCALQQMHLAQPRSAQLISGVKRDQSLLERVDFDSVDSVTVLDLPLPNNRDALVNLLDAGKTINYFDHHIPGDRLDHDQLNSQIDIDANMCTSLIVNRWLGGAVDLWAIVGTYGDNLLGPANALAAHAGLDDDETLLVADLGRLLNYNSYGERVDDLHFSPIELHKTMREYVDPLSFIREQQIYSQLREAYQQDLGHALNISGEPRPGGLVYKLPDLPWARRFVGTFANMIANICRDETIAILARQAGDHYRVHLRTPAASPITAGDFCRRFPSGGGRALAAGINCLPDADVDLFLNEFDRTFRRA